MFRPKEERVELNKETKLTCSVVAYNLCTGSLCTHYYYLIEAHTTTENNPYNT